MNREAVEGRFPLDEETFVFGPFCLIPGRRMLLEDGTLLRLGSRALDTLIALVEHAGETIRKDELIARIWPDTVVDEGALRVHIAALRKALGDGRPLKLDGLAFDVLMALIEAHGAVLSKDESL